MACRIRQFCAVPIKVMCPKLNLPKWEIGPDEIKYLNKDIVKRYKVSHISSIPLDHYLWIINQTREDKKWIEVWLCEPGTTKVYTTYKLNRIYAKRHSIEPKSILNITQFKSIHSSFIKKNEYQRNKK